MMAPRSVSSALVDAAGDVIDDGKGLRPTSATANARRCSTAGAGEGTGTARDAWCGGGGDGAQDAVSPVVLRARVLDAAALLGVGRVPVVGNVGVGGKNKGVTQAGARDTDAKGKEGTRKGVPTESSFSTGLAGGGAAEATEERADGGMNPPKF